MIFWRVKLVGCLHTAAEVIKHFLGAVCHFELGVSAGRLVHKISRSVACASRISINVISVDSLEACWNTSL